MDMKFYTVCAVMLWFQVLNVPCTAPESKPYFEREILNQILNWWDGFQLEIVETGLCISTFRLLDCSIRLLLLLFLRCLT